MKAEILKINPDSMDFEEMNRAGEILKRGGLVAFPTETVYGLGGNALDAKSSEKIYRAKGRPSDNPLIVHIADMEHLFPIVEQVPQKAVRLAEKFWPGPLTMIFKKTDMVPLETTGGLESVAVRMPDHPAALALIKAAGGYVAAPSANRSGRPSPTTAEHVAEDLGKTIDMILDGGSSIIGLESTIVDMTEETPIILRPGYISMNTLSRVVGDVIYDAAILEIGSNEPPRAPGMKYRHYAPKGELSIVKGEREKVIKYIKTQAENAIKSGERVGIIATEETYLNYSATVVQNIGSRDDEAQIARRLYAVLRDFDEDDITRIYSEDFDTPNMGQAIMNRLIKAAGHHIITL